MNRARRPPRTVSRRSGALLVALVLLAGCTERTPTPGDAEGASAAERSGPLPELLPLPDVRLTEAAAGVQKQIDTKRADLATLGSATPPDPVALAEAWQDLGLTFLVYDLLDAAEVALENARRLRPDAFESEYLLGYLLLVQGRLDEAIPRLERARASKPDYPPTLLRLGRARLDSGAPEAAEQLFRRALELDPASAAAWEGLGRIAAARGDDLAAAEAIARALELQPEANALHYVLGQTWRRLGDLERAREELAAAGDVQVRISDPLINPLAQQAASAQFFLVQGGEAMDDQRWEEAIAAYEKAIDLDDSQLRPYIAVAVAREQLGDRAGAARALRTGLETAEASGPQEEASAERYLGRMLVLQGDDREAIRRFERSLELLPTQPPVRIDLVDARARTGDWDRALAQLDRVLADHGAADPALLSRRAAILMNLDRGDEALDAYRDALAAGPDDAELRLRYAAALEHLGRPEEAARERADARRSADSDGTLALAEARRLRAEGRFEAALAAFEQVLASTPSHPEALLERGRLLGHLGRLPDARITLRRAVEAAPEARAARHAEIVALLLLESWGEARVRLNEALRRFPLDIEFARISARLLASAPDREVRDGELALRQAAAIVQARPNVVSAEILAMALAEAGQPGRAEAVQRQIVDAVQTGGDVGLLPALRERLLLYQRGEVWRARSPDDILSSPLAGAENLGITPG